MPSHVDMSSAQLNVTDKANDGKSLNVDFVAVRSDKLVQKIETLSASQWFEQKQQLLKDNPDNLIVWPVTMLPDSQITVKNVPISGKPADSLILFAGYQSKGAHRLILNDVRHPKLEFRDDDVYLFED
ncbi:hypothetical protein I2494_00315 [Budviciaceae bacterium BWR-B9]|uniref:Type VI secretion protein n=1 Tax=Limnobaculum allomyrinae TaxID=2791986 RepID=A0ABS1IKH5_9GAMM|nr:MULTISPECIES: hypothetical protein [Limnobaculum]MBK5142174.1 hypothetical protein [Limnobaculum allomyrinae]MBV7690942.1 hypothetical protein [Limnobaculum sp. M2-1]